MLERDNSQIFSSVAAKYYAVGLPVIPLHYHDKKPIPNDWSRFHEMMPTPDEQATWINHYGNCNVGLPLGRQAGLCFIDIDTEEAEVQKLITSLLPHTPWVRIGRKGMALAFKFTGIPTFRIKDSKGNMLVEMLSTRTQIVLPPSIHPDTKKPYVANCELVDVLDRLQPLDAQIEAILRGALQEAGIELSYSGWTRVTDFTPVGARDVKMTQVAGHYAYGVMRGELPLMEAVARMRVWHSTTVEKIAGDDVDIEKGIQNLVKFVARDVLEKKRILPKGWDEGLDEENKKAMGLNFTDDQEEWDFTRLKEYLHSNFEQYPEQDSAGRMNAINYALLKIAKASSMPVLDQERLLKYINEAGGIRMPLSSLRKQLRELAQGDLRGRDHTEIAKAVIGDLEQYGPLRHYGNKFWTWGGSHWVEKPEVDILKAIADSYGSMDAARKHSDHRGIMLIMRSLVPQEIKSVDVRAVNFANGVLFKSGELKKHDPSYGMTYTLPFRYLPDEKSRATKFFDFLRRVWGEDDDYQEKLAALQEALCVTIFGEGPDFQRAVLLYGAPKTGKSQLLEIAKALVPDGARAACPPDTWGDKFAPTTMHEKLINICGELSEKKLIDGQRFKQIICGEEMSGQLKGQQIFRFHPRCTHWFASNHTPRTEDSSEGFNRRWLVLTFNSPVTNKEIILNYGQTIVAEEREAIVSWAVEALPRLKEQPHYTLPTSHKTIIEEVSNINNSVRFFVTESGQVLVGPTQRPDGEKTSSPISEAMLHNAYWLFCLGAGGARPVSQRTFRQRMRELGIEMGFNQRMTTTDNNSPVYVYDGITLVEKAGR